MFPELRALRRAGRRGRRLAVRGGCAHGAEVGESPFLSDAGLTVTYLAWAGLWVALMLGLASLSFRRRDL